MSEFDARACRVGIAIVEDEKDLVKVYEMVFQTRGITICFVAYDGAEAVKKFIECMPRPPVVLMDYRLPIMNGIETTKEILKIEPGTKIVFISADISVKDEAMAAGAFTFLKKPASIYEITKAVENARGKRVT